MDLFLKHLDKIKGIAISISAKFNNRFQVDELVNDSYIKLHRAITNNPALIEGHFSKSSTLLFRIKSDMLDYARTELKLRAKDPPSFIPYLPEEGLVACSTESKFEETDNKDYVEELLLSCNLTDSEWSVIQGYFYDEISLKEMSKNMGMGETWICTKKKDLLDRIKFIDKLLV